MIGMVESKVSTEYDGKIRTLFPCHCKQCSCEFWRPKHILKKATCCSKECFKLYREKTGKRVDVVCAHCNKFFKRFRHLLAKVESKRYFCSRRCQQNASIKYRGNCKNCNCELVGYREKFYCSHDCHMEFKFKLNIEKWKCGELKGMHAGEAVNNWLRKYIFEKYENKCSLCGWDQINPITGKIPVQIDHIDGDYTNNREENLRLLCPNCHSLTPTYGALNLGKGRKKRRLKLQSNKITAL
jgi:HNH endonuclease